MALTAGVISLVSRAARQIQLAATAATLGTGPYTYQWYRSTVSGFTPGGGNILTGETALTLTDPALVPGAQYYYTVVATDSAMVPATVQYTEFAASTTLEQPEQNQFQQSAYLGMIDLRFPFNTVSVQIDLAETATLYAGSAVKMVDSANGVPKVLKCTADADNALGFINFNQKDATYTAGKLAEISMAGNVIFLRATGAIARGARVTLDTSAIGGVAELVGSSGDAIVGWAYDKAAAGDLLRVFLLTPSFAVA